jgi:hypothetical protein
MTTGTLGPGQSYLGPTHESPFFDYYSRLNDRTSVKVSGGSWFHGGTITLAFNTNTAFKAVVLSARTYLPLELLYAQTDDGRHMRATYSVKAVALTQEELMQAISALQQQVAAGS